MIIQEEHMSTQLHLRAIPVLVRMPPLGLVKSFIYYAEEDLTYNLDAFLLTTGLKLDCPKCRPDLVMSRYIPPQCPSCTFTFVLDRERESLLDLRTVVNPAEHLKVDCCLNFVKVDSLAK